MKFYVVRHGQTDWNAKGRIQGKTDIDFILKPLISLNC